MANAVFLIFRQFSHCAASFWDVKDRVVAKTAVSALFGDDLPFAGAFRKVRFAAWESNGDCGAETRYPRAGVRKQVL